MASVTHLYHALARAAVVERVGGFRCHRCAAWTPAAVPTTAVAWSEAPMPPSDPVCEHLMDRPLLDALAALMAEAAEPDLARRWRFALAGLSLARRRGGLRFALHLAPRAEGAAAAVLRATLTYTEAGAAREAAPAPPVLPVSISFVPGEALAVLADIVRDGPGELRPWQRGLFEVAWPGADALGRGEETASPGRWWAGALSWVSTAPAELRRAFNVEI